MLHILLEGLNYVNVVVIWKWNFVTLFSSCENRQPWSEHDKSSQVSSLDTILVYGAGDRKFKSRQFHCFHENWVYLESSCTKNSLLIVLNYKNENEIWGADPGSDGIYVGTYFAAVSIW